MWQKSREDFNKHYVKSSAVEKGLGTYTDVVQTEIEEILAKLWSWIWLSKFTWLVLSEQSAYIQSVIWQLIVMKKLPKLDVGKTKRGGFKSQ